MFESKGRLAVIQPDNIDRIVVFGDIHGDMRALREGLGHWKSKDLLVFLGDYADRGPDGVEVIEGIDALLSRYQDRVIALQGNHEVYNIDGTPTFSPCTLPDEAVRKKGSWSAFFGPFSAFVSKLHLSAILPNRCLFVHGGIGQGIDGVDDLSAPAGHLKQDLLWSDPGGDKGSKKSFRGIGSRFGADVTKSALNRIDVKTLIRSHEPRKAAAGPAFEHNDMVITTSSTSIYGGMPFVLVLDVNNFPQSAEDFRNAAVFL